VPKEEEGTIWLGRKSMLRREFAPRTHLRGFSGLLLVGAAVAQLFLELLGHRAERDRDFVHLDHEHG
jgi:hypothetical protein